MDWKPVDLADLALKAARVEKDAEAEAIFWEVWVADENQGTDSHAANVTQRLVSAAQSGLDC
jgi:hypothetical protein